MKKPHFRLLSILSALCLSISGLEPFAFPEVQRDFPDQSLYARTLPELTLTAWAAPSWPESPDIQADGGILVDADSGAVLFEKNADQSYYPASITKILTALVIIENCNLEDMVTFSHRAVNDVESGSSNMGALEGDQLSVRDCLYGLMLASANECANALAEHCAGSIEAFVDMMNQKARELGCTGSRFANPSGLNNENHYTTARDMSIIMKAAIENPIFLEIDGSLYWKHAPIKRYPDPDDPYNTIYAHHSMLKKNDSRYYAGAFAGKTGYTSLAGNTLVTCAKRDDMTLICVILNGRQTHYQDTKILFDYGFGNFRTGAVSDYDHSYTSIENDMTIAGLTASPISTLSLGEGCFITLPKNADFNDTETSLNYQPDPSAPSGSIARISYRYAGRDIGSSYLMIKNTKESMARMEQAAAKLSASETVGIPEPTTKSMDTEAIEAEDEAGRSRMTGQESPAADAEGQPDEDNLLPADTVNPDESPEGAGSSTALPSGNPQEAPSETSKGFSLSGILGRFGKSDSGVDQDSSRDTDSGFRLHFSAAFWIALAAIIVLASLVTAIILIKLHLDKKEEEAWYLRQERRRKRLKDIGYTPSDFEKIIEKRKGSAYGASRPKKRRRFKK